MSRRAPENPVQADVGTPWIAALSRDPPISTGHGNVDRIGRASDQLGAFWFWADAGEEVQTTESDSVVAVFFGRLHDRDAFAPTVVPESTSDAELILHLYRRRRERGLDVLRGSFALVLWDAERELLLALRDPLGYYPLFYIKREEGLLLSVSQDQLLRQCIVSKDVNRPVAAAWVSGHPHDPRQTLFADICRLPPGHVLRVDRHGLQLSRYWCPHIPEQPAVLEATEAFERFDALVSRSVDNSLDLGCVGVFLSGGIDSAAIAGFALERSRSRGLPDPVALSLTFPYPGSDESETQVAVARALGMRHIQFRANDTFGPEGAVRAALQIVRELPIPLTHPAAVPFYRLASEGVGQGCQVLLTGEGSEWFSAEWESAADLILNFDLFGLHALCESERRYMGSSWSNTAKELVWRNGIRLLLSDTVGASLGTIGADSIFTGLRTRRRIRSFPEWVVPEPGLRRELAENVVSLAPHPIVGSRYRTARLNLLNDPRSNVAMDLNYTQSAKFGAPLHDPFNDPGLIQFLLTLPPKLLWEGRQAKALAVAAIRKRLPTLDTNVLRVSSFEHALELLIARQGRYALDDFGVTPILASLGVVDPGPLAALLNRSEFVPGVRYDHAWKAIALEAWLQARLR